MERRERLAAELLALSRDTLLMEFRFLDTALFRLDPVPGEPRFATDGARLVYDPTYILKLWRREEGELTRAWMHVLLHCLLRHPFGPPPHRENWDLACDLAVEDLITSLNAVCLTTRRETEQQRQLALLRPAVKTLTAERIYRYLEKHPPQELGIDPALFTADDHSLWASETRKSDSGQEDSPQGRSGGDGLSDDEPASTGGGQGDDPEDSKTGEDRHAAKAEGTSGDQDTDRAGEEEVALRTRRAVLSDQGSAEKERDWRELSERVKEDLETFSRSRQADTGELKRQLWMANRAKTDWSALLRQFAFPGEVARVSQEEFDQIAYTYGLRMNGNMPLIEPLEYREEDQIREFVVAIDTSASTSGALVERFVAKTCELLLDRRAFAERVRVYILQCDAAVRECVCVTNEAEVRAYLERMTLKGMGGTDFRPIFQKVDELLAQGGLRELKGLICFTDGEGVFPEKMPPYRTVFAFLQGEREIPEVPPWAIRVVLEDEL